MTKERELSIAIIFMVVAIITFALGIARSQEVFLNIDVAEGTIIEKTTFSAVSHFGDNHFKDSYQSSFRTHNANIAFSKNFTEEGVTTKITGVAPFIIKNKEVIGTTQIYGNNCCATAAGSKFFVTGIEYTGIASPGGIGECCGVNFSADVPQSIGRLSAAVIYKHIGETVIPAEEEGGTDTVVFEDSLQKNEVDINGNQNGFNFVTNSKVCSPADEPPKQPFFEFKLCTDGPNALMPWNSITP